MATEKVVNGKKVYIYRLRAEAALGKPLPAGAVVHHADGSRSDDGPLVICQDNGYHRFLHYRMRIKSLGGNPNTDAYCGRCKTIKPKEAFAFESQKPYVQLNGWCKECRRKDGRARYKKYGRRVCRTH